MTREKNFDELAETYDDWYKTQLGIVCDTLEKEAIFSLTEVNGEKMVLDVSCGTGNIAIEIAKRGGKVVALDNSRKMLKVFQEKIEKENVCIDLKYANSENLQFSDNNFDIVFSILNLEFTQYSNLVIRECLRVLKPDGRLIIGILNKYSIWTLIRKTKSIFVNSIWRYAYFFTLRELSKLISDENGETEEIKHAIYFPPINQKYFLKLYKIFECIGKKAFPCFSAFIAIAVKKKICGTRIKIGGEK